MIFEKQHKKYYNLGTRRLSCKDISKNNTIKDKTDIINNKLQENTISKYTQSPTNISKKKPLSYYIKHNYFGINPIENLQHKNITLKFSTARIVLTQTPSQYKLDKYIKLLQHKHVKYLLCTSKPTYDTKPIQDAGIKIIILPIDEIINRKQLQLWVKLLYSTFPEFGVNDVHESLINTIKDDESTYDTLLYDDIGMIELLLDNNNTKRKLTIEDKINNTVQNKSDILLTRNIVDTTISSLNTTLKDQKNITTTMYPINYYESLSLSNKDKSYIDAKKSCVKMDEYTSENLTNNTSISSSIDSDTNILLYGNTNKYTYDTSINKQNNGIVSSNSSNSKIYYGDTTSTTVISSYSHIDDSQIELSYENNKIEIYDTLNDQLQDILLNNIPSPSLTSPLSSSSNVYLKKDTILSHTVKTLRNILLKRERKVIKDTDNIITKKIDKDINSVTSKESIYKEKTAIAIECISGFSKGPFLASIALVEAGFSADEAISIIRSKRPGSLSSAQLLFLQDYIPKGPPVSPIHRIICRLNSLLN